MSLAEHPLKEFIPETAIDYIENLISDTFVLLTVTGKRKYSQGTFRDKNKKGRYRISVSGTLNSYAFLITLIHEIAHLKTFQLHGRKVMPHGIEWKNIFINLLTPLLKENIFPEDIKQVLTNHLKNPKASSSADPALVKVLARYNNSNKETVFLDEIKTGEHFYYDRKEFIKDETIRKRILCYDAKSKRKYLFNPIAEVLPLRS